MTDEKTRDVNLTDDEIIALDGKVNDKAQQKVDYVKSVHEHDSLGNILAQEILVDSLKQNYISVRNRELTSCGNCDVRTTYAVFKSGPRKGEQNRNKPRPVYGMSFNDGFIIITGYSSRGLCKDCGNKMKQLLQDYILENDLPIEIGYSLKDTRYLKEEERQCFKCEKPMWQFDMGTHPTMMGGGYYHATCPHCNAQSLGFGPSHKHTHNTRATRKDELVEKHHNFWIRPKKTDNI